MSLLISPIYITNICVLKLVWKDDSLHKVQVPKNIQMPLPVSYYVSFLRLVFKTCQAWMDVSSKWQTHIHAQTLTNLWYNYAEVCACWMLVAVNE